MRFNMGLLKMLSIFVFLILITPCYSANQYYYQNEPIKNTQGEKIIVERLDRIMKDLDNGAAGRDYFFMTQDAHNYMNMRGSHFQDIPSMQNINNLETEIGLWKKRNGGLILLYGIIETTLKARKNSISLDPIFDKFMETVDDIYENSLNNYNQGIANNNKDLIKIALLKLEFIKPYKDSNSLLNKYLAQFNKLKEKEKIQAEIALQKQKEKEQKTKAQQELKRKELERKEIERQELIRKQRKEKEQQELEMAQKRREQKLEDQKKWEQELNQKMQEQEELNKKQKTANAKKKGCINYYGDTYDLLLKINMNQANPNNYINHCFSSPCGWMIENLIGNYVIYCNSSNKDLWLKFAVKREKDKYYSVNSFISCDDKFLKLKGFERFKNVLGGEFQLLVFEEMK